MPQIRILNNNFLFLAPTNIKTPRPTGKNNSPKLKDTTESEKESTSENPKENDEEGEKKQGDDVENKTKDGDNSFTESVQSISKFQLNQLDFLFVKSYYAANSLTSYIRCFILNKSYEKKEFVSDIRKKNFEKNFFDIPYNLIRSMELEYAAGGGVEGKLTLKLEDATGSIGAFLVSAFYALSSTGESSKSAHIGINFGWSSSGFNPTSNSRKDKKFYRSNIYSNFLIIDVQLTFNEKGRQEITITAQQDGTGQAQKIALDPGNSPHAYLGPNPIHNIRLIQYYYFIYDLFEDNQEDLVQREKNNRKKKNSGNNNNNNNKTKNTNSGTEEEKLIQQVTKNNPKLFADYNKFFPMYKSYKKPEDKTNFHRIMLNFYWTTPKEDFTLEEIKKTQENFRKSLTYFLSDKNKFFNIFGSNIMNKNFNDVRQLLSPIIQKTYYNSYLVFCYILNQYIKLLKQIFKDESDDCEIELITFFNEKNIDTTGLLVDKITEVSNFTEIGKFCRKDILLNNKKPKNPINTLSDFTISPNENWESLITRLGNLVKFTDSKDPKKQSSLHISIKRYKHTEFGKTQPNSADFYKTSEKKEIIEKLKAIQKVLPEGNKTVEGLELNRIINNIEKTPKDFVVIMISRGPIFLTEFNVKSKLVAQSYTVFPHIKPTNRISDQNFNSGSKKLSDESFPDVIYFKPTFSYKNVIASNLVSRSNINYNNGTFTFKTENFGIKTTDNKEISDTKVLFQIKDVLTNALKKVKPNEDAKKNNTVKTKKINNNKKPTNNKKASSNKSLIKLDFEFFGLDNKDGLNYFTLNEIPGYKIHSVEFQKIIDNEKTKNSKYLSENYIQRLLIDLNEYINAYNRGYQHSTLLSIIKKSNSVFIGDNNVAQYYNYVKSATEYNKELASRAKGFEAELKILGEPAYTGDWGVFHVLIKVNNADGTPNVLLTGLYSVHKIKHDITESGGFTTTLTLKYDTPYEHE